MNNSYKNRIASPYHPAKKDVFDVSRVTHPVREIIAKCKGVYTLTASFEEDTETASKLVHTPGVVAFICTIKNGNRVLGVGRGHTILGPQSRYVERVVHTAFNYSLIDAISKMTRAFNSLRTDLISEPHITTPTETITEKQKIYLLELIDLNVTDEEEKERWSKQIDDLTKDEASEAIQSFKK